MRLETKRLILREWKNADLEDLVEGLNNLTVARWLAFVPHPYTKKDAKNWMEHCIKNAKKGGKRCAYETGLLKEEWREGIR